MPVEVGLGEHGAVATFRASCPIDKLGNIHGVPSLGSTVLEGCPLGFPQGRGGEGRGGQGRGEERWGGEGQERGGEGRGGEEEEGKGRTGQGRAGRSGLWAETLRTKGLGTSRGLVLALHEPRVHSSHRRGRGCAQRRICTP